MHLDIIKNKLKFLKEIMWLRNLMQSLDTLKNIRGRRKDDISSLCMDQTTSGLFHYLSH